MTTGLLHAEALRCERDDRLLFSDLNVSFDAGTITHVSGPNGSGKTTLLRILAGLYQSYEGKLFFKGQSFHSHFSEFCQDLLFIGHKSAVKTTMTVLENLSFRMSLQQSVDADQLYGALERVGLAGYEDVLCKNLSAGQQRRVALAQLYLSEAKVWILDEIFTAIDLKGVAQLEALLEQKAQAGNTIILTTHHRLSIASARSLALGSTRRVEP